MKIRRVFVVFMVLISLFSLPMCSNKSTNKENEENTRKYPFVDVTRPLSKEEKLIAGGINEFAFNFLRVKTTHDYSSTDFRGKDIIFSPFSISMAFSLALIGAKGETYSQMVNTLGFPGLTTQQVEENFNSLFLILVNLDNDIEFDIANSAWFKEGIDPVQEYIDALKKYFYADIFLNQDFRDEDTIKRIDQWIAEHTNYKIKKAASIPPDAVFVLINAIYFLGGWTYPFDVSETREDTFVNYYGEKVTVEMMHIRHEFRYCTGKDYQAISLPYGNEKFFMTIILPDKGVDIYNFVTSEVRSAFSSVLTAETHDVSLYLPKFEKKLPPYLLKKYMISLGMEDAFDHSRADFSGIIPASYGRVWIDDAIHKTYIRVDEKGTEAAAVTIIIGVGSYIPPEVEMRVDHPFIFMIHDVKTNSILFMGVVMDPSIRGSE